MMLLIFITKSGISIRRWCLAGCRCHFMVVLIPVVCNSVLNDFHCFIIPVLHKLVTHRLLFCLFLLSAPHHFEVHHLVIGVEN